MIKSLNCPNFNFIYLPVFFLSRQKNFAINFFGHFINVSKHAVRVAEIFKSYEEVAYVCFTKSWRVFCFVLLYCVVSLVLANWTSDRASLLSICHAKQIRLERVSIGEVTDPARRIKSSKNMTVVSPYYHKCGALIITAVVKALRSLKLKCNDAAISLYSSFYLCLCYPFVLNLLQVLPSLKFFFGVLQLFGVLVQKLGSFNWRIGRHYLNQEIDVKMFGS